MDVFMGVIVVYKPINIYIYTIYLIIWVNFITTSLFSRALEIIVYFREIIPFYGRKIQVSEILWPLPRCVVGGDWNIGEMYGVMMVNHG